jgi:hypothetical protein
MGFDFMESFFYHFKIMERNLYNHVFWYNEYEELWYAIPRDHQIEFFGKGGKHLALSSKNINVLVELVSKPELLKKLENEQPTPDA